MKIPITTSIRITAHRTARMFLASLCLVLALFNVPAFAGGGTFTWNGASGTTGNWSDGSNWGGTAPTDPQNFLNFNGATRTSSTNDFANGSPGYQIYFKSGANAFNLYGNSITFYDFGGGVNDPNIQNEGAVTNQTINFPVANGNNNGTFHVLNLNVNTGTSQGPLTFNGTVSSADAGQPLRVINIYGPSAISFNGIISDFDSTHLLALSQLGSGTTTLRATNTFTGDMTVNAGTLVLATNSALANGANFIRLGDTTGSTGANLNLNGGNNLSTSINVRSGSSGGKIIANTSGTTGNAAFAGNLYLDADATLFANANGGNTLSGSTLDLKNQTLTLDGTGSNTISGTLQNSTGSGKLVKNNTGTLYLNSAASYTGGTTINGSNIVQVSANNAFGTGGVSMNNTSGVARILLNGAIITNALTISVANAGTGLGVIQAIDTTTATWSGPITINSNAASGGHFVGPLSSGLLTISGAVTLGSSAATLAVRDGIVRFSGGGSYTNMLINAGTTSLGANNGLATTTIVDVGPTARTTLDLNGFNQTLAGVRNSSLGAQVNWVTNSAAATQSTLTLAVSNLTVFNGSIVGNLAVNVVGGTQIYSNSAVAGNGVFGYTGDTTITNGTLKLGAANLLPSGSGKGNMIVTNTGVLDLNTFSQTINGLSGNGTIDTVAGGTPNLSVGSNGVSSTFSGLIKNTSGTLALTKIGSGTLTLAGANNTFGGGVNIGVNATGLRIGVVRAAANQALGTGAIQPGVGGNDATGRLELSNSISLNNYINLPLRNTSSAAVESVSGNNTLTGTIGLNSGGGTAIIQSDAGLLTLGTGGSIAVSNQVAASTRIITLSGAGNGTVAGNIVDMGAAVVGLIKDGAGQWTLSGVDTYSGDTRITNGTLLVNNTLALQNSSVDMNAADAGTLNLNNLNATLGGLKGSRNLALGTGTVSVGNNNAATTYSGALSGNALTKVGTGALTLSGNNAHTGATTISAGELIGQSGGSISNNTVSVSAGATNGVLVATANGQWVCGNLTYSAGTTYADFNFNGIAPSTTTAPIQVNGALAFTVTPNLIVRSANATIAPGQYPLIKYTGALSGTPPSTVLSLPVGLTANISNNVANSSIDLVVTVGNAVQWAVGNGAWDINTTANWKNTTGSAVNYLDGEAVVLDDTATGASPISLTLSASVTPLSITANVTNKNYTIVSNQFAILGSGPLTKNGSGTLTVGTLNSSYAGSIAFNAGTIALGANGGLGTGPMTMNNGTTLSMPNSGTSVFPGNAITIPAGATATFSTTALGNGIAGTVTSGDSTSTINITGSVSFSATTRQLDPFTGTVNISSGNTLRFSNTSGGNGSTNANFVVNGTLQPRNANLVMMLGSLSGSGILAGPQTPAASTSPVTYNIGTNNASTTFSGRFTELNLPPGASTTNNPTTIVKVGTGTLTLSGVSTNTGSTTVSAGALMGVTGGALINSAITVAAGATNGVNVTVPGSQFTITNLTYAAGTATALFAFGGNTPSTTVAPLQVLNNLTISGTLNIIVTGSSFIPVGTYPLISYVNTLSGTPPAVPLSLPPYINGVIVNDTANKLISLNVTSVSTPPALVWSAGTGNWDFSSLNWTNSAGATVAWADTNAALLDDTASGTGPFTVTLTTNVVPTGVTFNNTNKDYTLAGTGGLTGNNPLTKAGTGMLTIANSNSLVGITTISAGTLQLGNGGTSGSLANMAIVDNSALVINHSDAVAIATAISGTGSFTNAGGGTTTLSVTNTYAGNTTVKAGTLQLTDAGNLAPTSTLVLAGGQFTRAAQNFNPVKTNAYKFGLAVVANSTVATTATTTRTVHFDTANITAVPGTTLLVTNTAATGTNHFKFYAGGFNYAGNLVLGGNGANNMAFLESYNTNDTLPDQIFSGIISGQGKIYKNIEGSSPGGNLIISNAANTFSGGTELRAGYIGLGADNPLGTNRVTFGFDFNLLGFYAVDAARTLTNDIFADANSASAATAAGCTNLAIKGSQNLTLSGRILIATNVQFFTINNTALTTFSGVISNAAANSLGIAKQGAGTLVVSGNNAYSGDTRVNLGMLRLGASNVIPDGAGKGNVAVADTLDLNTFSETINGLSGAGIIDTVAGGNPVLTVGNNNASSSFSGVIKNTAGALSLTKTGSGVLTLSGANSYIGTTVIGNGTLALSGASATLASSGIAVSTGALFDVSGVPGGFTLGATQTLSGFGSVNGTLTNNGTIAPGASIGTLTLSNSPVLNGTVLMELNRTNAQNADLLVLAAGTLNYGSTLTVTNLGDPLQNGDTFTLFQAASYSGSFTNIVLPTLTGVLIWNTNNLAVNGSISVVPGISPTALALGSSANPSGYLDSLTFTANVTPTNAAGTVTFFNGATPFSTNNLLAGTAVSDSISTLPRGTNPITAIYNGAVNYYTSTNSLAQLVTNHPPVAASVSYYRGAVADFKITISDLMTNATDVDGDTLAVSFGTSTNGINLTVSGNLALYSNTNLVNDQLTYTVSDAFGGTNSASITITASPFLTGQDTTVAVSGSTATVSFAGIPGYHYGVQRSTNLVDWATITTTNAPSGGLFNYTDDFSDLGGVPGSAYYRLQWNP